MPARLALIGTGRWGANIEKTIGLMPSCELAYTATHNWRDFLTKRDIDGVIIATPPSSHTEIALAFIEQKTPVFIEKPMTVSLDEANTLVSASEHYSVPVMVGHIHLFNPAYITFKTSLPLLGPLHHVSARMAHDGPRRPDYSALWDIAPHPLSLVLDLAGMPTELKALGKTIPELATGFIDEATIDLKFKNNVTGHVELSWAAPLKEAWLKVECENGTALYNDRAEIKVTITEDGVVSRPSYVGTSPLESELSMFIRTIKEGVSCQSNAAFGRDIVHIIALADESIRETF